MTNFAFFYPETCLNVLPLIVQFLILLRKPVNIAICHIVSHFVIQKKYTIGN